MTTDEGPTIAAMVTAPVLTVGMNQPTDEVRAAMRRRGVRFAVVDQGGRITAVLDLLAMSHPPPNGRRRQLVRDVVHPGMVCLRADATPQAAARLLRVTGSAAVPVVDEHHHLLGLITADDLPGAGPCPDPAGTFGP